MNTLIVQNQIARTISESAFSTVPTMGEGILESLWKHPDQITFGVASLAFLSYVFTKILQPAVERISIARAEKIKAEQRLIEHAAEVQAQIPHDLDTIVNDSGTIARALIRIGDRIQDGCAAGHVPLSDTTLTSLDEIAERPKRKRAQKPSTPGETAK